MNKRVDSVVDYIIRKARNHCQGVLVHNCGDEDHCQYHLGIDHCQTGNHCQDALVDNCGDEDHCQYHLGIDHCQTGNHCQDALVDYCETVEKVPFGDLLLQDLGILQPNKSYFI